MIQINFAVQLLFIKLASSQLETLEYSRDLCDFNGVNISDKNAKIKLSDGRCGELTFKSISNKAFPNNIFVFNPNVSRIIIDNCIIDNINFFETSVSKALKELTIKNSVVNITKFAL